MHCRLVARALVVALLPLLPACATTGQLALVDATVIDPEAGTTTPHRTVIVGKDRIVAVQDAADRLPAGTRRIDARGKFVIPGLWDAHAHLSKAGEAGLALYLANGITGVRDMGSNLEEVAGWRTATAAGTLMGPRIRIAGPMLESAKNVARIRSEGGVENVDRQRLGVATAEEGRAAVQRLAAAGVDHIKMRTSPDPATFVAIGEEAHKLGLPFAAHPQPIDTMLSAHLTSSEHYLTYPPTDAADPERAALFARVAAAGLAVDLTFVNFRVGVLTPYETAKRILAADGSAIDARRKYLCGYPLADWAEQVEEAKNGAFGPVNQVLPGWLQDFRDMHRAGVTLMAGSDAGVAFTYPGFSMQDQIGLLVTELGLSPMEALRIATSGVPRFYGTPAGQSLLAAGKPADLVLLDADPLADIAATRRIAGVIAQGHWHSRTDLDALLARVAEDAAGPCALGSKAGLPLGG